MRMLLLQASKSLKFVFFPSLCGTKGGGGVNEGSDHVLVLYMYKLYHNNLSFSLCVAEGGGVLMKAATML